MNQIATRPPRGQKQPAERSEPNAIVVPMPEMSLADRLLYFAARALEDGSFDADKLTVLLVTQRELVADEARRQREEKAEEARLAYQRAMKLAIDAMPAIVRKTPNSSTNSKYARYEVIEMAIRPIYSEYGFYLTFSEDVTAGTEIIVECHCVHATSGHKEIFRKSGALDLNGPKGNPNKTPLHASASTVSYLRRQLTCMIFNVVLENEDNDGNRTFADTGELIPPAKVKVLYDLLAQCSSSAPAEAERRFLNVMKLDRLASLRDAPAGEFKRLQSALLAKCARMGSPS